MLWRFALLASELRRVLCRSVLLTNELGRSECQIIAYSYMASFLLPVVFVFSLLDKHALDDKILYDLIEFSIIEA